MTKKLEELLNLAPSEEEEINIQPDIVDTTPGVISSDTLATIEKVESALPQVRGLETSDQELDNLADLAKEAFQNLLDLGMQVDSRFSAEIFNSASSMLGHAITARTAKVNKKLKMIDLQLKKAELDRKLASAPAKAPEERDLGLAQVIDRNELVRMIAQSGSKTGKNDK
jgi:hypothetical protein